MERLVVEPAQRMEKVASSALDTCPTHSGVVIPNVKASLSATGRWCRRCNRALDPACCPLPGPRSRRTQEHENRFWTSVAFCFSGALVFVPDSPVAVGQWSPVLGFLLVMLFTFSVHSYDRQVEPEKCSSSRSLGDPYLCPGPDFLCLVGLVDRS